jgi:hypothetical protein
MDDRVMVLVHRDKIYVVDFSEWIVDDEERVYEMHMGLSLMTVEERERESMYTRKEVRRALEAGEFLKSMGYPTEQEAINIVQSGNILNIPYSVEDVKRFFDVCGTQAVGLRGETTKKKAMPATRQDLGARQQITDQVMVGDVMHAAGGFFFVSISSPLSSR